MSASLKHVSLLANRAAQNAVLSAICFSTNMIQVRGINKHYHPEFKRQRREKFLKVDLPCYSELHKYLRQEFTPAEIRAFMRQKGILPYRRDAPVVSLSDSGSVLDAYVPKEGDGMVSDLSDVTTGVTKKGTRWNALRHIRKLEVDFDIDSFPEAAQDIYVNAHQLLTKVFPRNFLSQYRDDEDYYSLHNLVTEYGWPRITQGLENKTLIWKFVESLEAPKVVNVVCKDAKKEDNKYAQITVRFHSKQIMALYDRFGRLLYGSNDVHKDVLDFVVFEKHLSDSYGKWRIHDKIIPDWKKRQDDFRQTLVMNQNLELGPEIANGSIVEA